VKKLLGLLIVLILGLALGGGAAFGVAQLLGPPAPKSDAIEEVETKFVSAGTILAPIVAVDGKLSGYANFDVQLEVHADKEAEVTEKLPLLLNAVNLRTWQTPLAAGPDHILPDLRAFTHVVDAAAAEALGKGVIKRVIVTAARPA
jgi:hypothetical protein